MPKDMIGNEIEIGDIVKVYSLRGSMSMMKGESRVLGKGLVTSTDGIPSKPEAMVWVKNIPSCHAPDACRVCFKKDTETAKGF